MSNLFDSFMAAVVVILCILLIGFIFIFAPLLIYYRWTSPDLATLKKNEWSCTHEHTEMIWIYNGSSSFPIINHICDQYGRN